MQVEASLTGHPVRMVSRTGLAWLLVMVVLAAGSPVGAAAEPAREELLPPRWPPPITLISGVSAVLVDAGSGQILLEQNAIEARPMASLVKIMTLRLALAALGRGELDPDQEVVVTPEASWLHWPGSSLMFLREGDRVTIRDLLYGVAVASGNEACVALAQAVSGSVEAYIDDMNLEAARLSLSALDAVRLTRAYLRDAPEALIYHSTLEYTYAGITQRNRNRLLSSYPGVDGVKTGFTSLAGHNLVASFAGDGRRLIAVVTGVPSRLDGAVMGTTRGQDYRDAVIARMLDWAREEFRTLRLLEAGEEIGRLPVYQGTSRSVVIGPAWPVVLTLALAEMDNIETSVDFESAYLVAPVEVGTRVGTLLVAASGTEVVKVDLVVAQAIPRGGFLRVVWDSLRLLFAPVVHRSLGQDRPTSGEP